MTFQNPIFRLVMLHYPFLPKAVYPKPAKSLKKHKMERLACCRKALKDNGLGSVSTDLAELEKDGARLGWQGHKGFAATCSIATALPNENYSNKSIAM